MTLLKTTLCLVVGLRTFSSSRPLPSFLVPLFQSEVKCKAIYMRTDFDLHEIETACRIHFHMKGFGLRLVLKQRHERTQKWPIIKNRAVFICRKIIGFALPYFMPHAWLNNTRATLSK